MSTEPTQAAGVPWGPIIGVVIGYFLSQVTTFIVWWFSQKREKRSIRTFIGLEIEDNLSLLHDYWYDVSLDDESEDFKHEVKADKLVRRAVAIPIPMFSRKAFDSQLTNFTKAFSEQQMRRIWEIYRELSQIEPVHAALVEIVRDPTSEKGQLARASRAMRSAGLRSATFTTKSASALMDLQTIIEGLLKRRRETIMTTH
jgi:hypothetical protein